MAKSVMPYEFLLHTKVVHWMCKLSIVKYRNWELWMFLYFKDFQDSDTSHSTAKHESLKWYFQLCLLTFIYIQRIQEQKPSG